MESVKEKIKGRISSIPKEKVKEISWHIFYIFSSFFMSSISFAGGISPFAAAFTGASLPEYLLSVSLGAAGGYLLFCSSFDALKYVATVTLICFIKYGAAKIIKPTYRMYIYIAVSFFACLFCSLTVLLASGTDSAGILLCVSEALITAAVCCFFFRIFNMFILETRRFCFSSGDTAAFLFFISVILLSFDNFPIFGVYPSHIIAPFLILLFSFCGKEASGTLAGVCCAVTLGLGDTQPHLLLAYSLGGLFAGLCSEYGKLAATVSFSVSFVLSLIIKGDANAAFIALCECAAGVVLFFITPKKILQKAADRLSPLSRDAFSFESAQIISHSIRKTASALSDISESVTAVSSLLAKADMPSSSDIPGSVKEDVCEDCIKKDFCWKQSHKISKKAFSEAYSVLMKNGRLTPETLPERLDIVCRAKNSLADSFNRYLCEYNAKIAVRNEILDTKALAASQFYSVSRILEDTSEKMKEPFISDSVTCFFVKEVLIQFSFDFKCVFARTDNFGRSFLEVYCDKIPPQFDFTALNEALFMRTDIQYMPPVIEEYKNFGTVLNFCEKTVFSASCVCSSHKGAGENFSGDTFKSFLDGKGNFYAVLSDGMGTGQRAALDSLMTSFLFSKLTKAGFSPQRTVENINSALMVKSDGETLSTLDVLKIDLYTGKTQIYKAGAAFSVIKKSEKTAIVEQSSLPLGILKEAKFEKTETELSAGDLIVLISDGASVLSPNHFKDMLQKNKDKHIKQLADEIVKSALELSSVGKNDDITAAVVKLKRV